ncbi:MAG: alpha/beta hydrolase [Proteobacteria bacterium]|nr:alpha/beta hydrolase [Pseudomonadota bacterium]
MTDKIYRDYTQEELDLQYTNLVTDHDRETQQALQARSADVANHDADARDLKYGNDPDNRFDLYRAGSDPKPAIIFTHGGQWQRGGAATSAAWARAAVENNVTFVAGTFPMIPRVRLAEMVDHVTALVRHVRSNAEDIGVDPTRICISGHSSGAHLAAAVLVRLANEDDLDGIVCGLTVSGNYDLRPLMLSYRREYLVLSEDETVALSPLLTLDKTLPPTLIAHGGAESDEFMRQAATFHAALAKQTETDLHVVPDANHFEVFADLEDPASPVWDFLNRYL